MTRASSGRKRRTRRTRKKNDSPSLPPDGAATGRGATDDLDEELVEVEPELVLDAGDDAGVLDDAALEDVDVESAASAGRHDETDDASGRALAPAIATQSPSTALVPRDALGAYLAQIRQYPVLSREEEHELAVRYYEHGDLDAARKLITSNLRLVVMIAREYQRAFHNLLDLIQEGNVGLLEAVKNFDPYRGVRLPSYAVWWIRAYIIRYVMNNFRLVKVGTTQAQRRLFFNLQKEKARLEAAGFKPTPKLIAQNLGVKEEEVVEMDMRMGASELSVDATVGADAETPVIELMSEPDRPTAEDEVADREFYSLMKAKLEEFGRALEGREKEIFEQRLMAEDPKTLQELGERWGVSRERVRQIEEALKRRLREFLIAEIRDVPQLP